jgi:hypothetical protein
MTIKDVFDQNKGKIIVIWHNRTYQKFHDYQDYITYLNNYFGDKVVIAIINSELKKYSKNSYSLDVVVETEIPKICIYEGFWWDVEK